MDDFSYEWKEFIDKAVENLLYSLGFMDSDMLSTLVEHELMIRQLERRPYGTPESLANDLIREISMLEDEDGIIHHFTIEDEYIPAALQAIDILRKELLKND